MVGEDILIKYFFLVIFAVDWVPLSAWPPVTPFRVNRAFVYFILNESDLVVFSGRVTSCEHSEDSRK